MDLYEQKLKNSYFDDPFVLMLVCYNMFFLY